MLFHSQGMHLGWDCKDAAIKCLGWGHIKAWGLRWVLLWLPLFCSDQPILIRLGYMHPLRPGLKICQEPIAWYWTMRTESRRDWCKYYLSLIWMVRLPRHTCPTDQGSSWQYVKMPFCFCTSRFRSFPAVEILADYHKNRREYRHFPRLPGKFNIDPTK